MLMVYCYNLDFITKCVKLLYIAVEGYMNGNLLRVAVIVCETLHVTVVKYVNGNCYT